MTKSTELLRDAVYLLLVRHVEERKGTFSFRFPIFRSALLKALQASEACSALRSALLNIGGFSALAFGQSMILVSLQFSVALHSFLLINYVSMYFL